MGKPRKDSYEVRVKPKLDLVVGWCRRGLTNEQIAENLGISEQSFTNYIKRYEEFADAVDKGREETEIHIENALVKRALGYSYKEVTRERKQVLNPETGEMEYKLVVTKSVTKHVIPDVGAQQYYLEHRAPKRWERVPQQYLDSNQINRDIQSIAELLNNPAPERQIGDEEVMD
jgi:predicted transcriptional regulator